MQSLKMWPPSLLVLGAALPALLGACASSTASNGPGNDTPIMNGPSAGQSGGGGASSLGGTANMGGVGVAGAGSSKPEVGVVTIRRLNRTHYGNTLRSLTGTSKDFGAQFPPDDLSFGFDSIGEGLSLQPLHIELYEQSADTVLSDLFALPASDPNRSKVLGACDLATGGHTCVASTVLAFAARAYRRPVEAAEVAPFVSIADQFTMTGGTAVEGLKLALKAVLLSPHFLFRVEQDPSPTSKDVHRLNAYELATRLSYYLWSDMPDDALMNSAKSGTLATDPGLVGEVTRMLGDARSRALVSDFAGQWLSVRRVLSVKPDATEYPLFGPELAADMSTESYMLFADVLSQARPITELFTANYTFLNKRLATFYGLTPPAADGFVKTPLAGSPRSGFLMQGTFLAMTSNPTRTSPVKRGKWVLEQLLCSPPPPPPMGVNTTLPDGGSQSVRAKLEQHRAKEPCHTCHALMDPIGLSFENFDGIGSYRTSDKYGPIDATGSLMTAQGEVKFNGATEMLPVVSTDPRLTPCVAEKVLTYAVGRGFNSDDALALQNVLTATNATGQGLRGLVGSVALSEAFRSRRAVGE